MPSTQTRLSLSRALADHDQRPASSLVARQISPSITASTGYPQDIDEAKVNATGGAVALTLPLGSDEIIGLPFLALKTDSSSNAVSLTRSGTDTFAGGGTSISTTAQNARIGAYWDGANWRDWFAGSVSTGLAVSSGLTVASGGLTVTAGGISVAAGNVVVPLVNYANDAAAAAGGVPLNGLYHTAGAVKIRLV